MKRPVETPAKSPRAPAGKAKVKAKAKGAAASPGATTDAAANPAANPATGSAASPAAGATPSGPGPRPDASPDARPETRPDAGPDARPDARPEAPPDRGPLFRAAMQRVPSPVSVVAWVDADGCGGMTCTAVSSAGAMPPRLSVCIRAASSAARRIRAVGAFSVNFLTEDQGPVARSFSASGRGDAGPFDHGTWRPGPTGAPLLDDAVAAFECRLDQVVESGAHVILLGRVERQVAGTGGGLLYRDGFLRRVAAE